MSMRFSALAFRTKPWHKQTSTLTYGSFSMEDKNSSEPEKTEGEKPTADNSGSGARKEGGRAAESKKEDQSSRSTSGKDSKRPAPRREAVDRSDREGKGPPLAPETMFQSHAKVGVAMMEAAGKVFQSNNSSFNFGWPDLPEVVACVEAGKPVRTHVLAPICDAYLQVFKKKLEKGMTCACSAFGDKKLPCCMAVVSYATHSCFYYGVNIEQHYESHKEFSAVGLSLNVMNMVGIALTMAEGLMDEKARAIVGIRQYKDSLIIPITRCIYDNSKNDDVLAIVKERVDLIRDLNREVPSGIKTARIDDDTFQRDMTHLAVERLNADLERAKKSFLPQSWDDYFGAMTKEFPGKLDFYKAKLTAAEYTLDALRDAILGLDSAEDFKAALCTDPDAEFESPTVYLKLVKYAGVTSEGQKDAVLAKLKRYILLVHDTTAKSD